MTKQQSYRVVSFAILALSIAAAIFLAYSLGVVIHSATSVGSAPTAPAPTSAGWIAIVLSAIATFAGPSWSKFFQNLADAAPVITTIAGQLPQFQNFSAKLKVSPLGALLPLLEGIDISSGKSLTSTGSHPVPGGSVDWKISFTPTTLPE